MSAPGLRLVETVVLRPGSTEDYLTALRRDYLPITEGHGLRLRDVLRTPDGGGEEELVLIWDVDDWDAYCAFRAHFQFHAEPAATRWTALADSLRLGGRRRLLVPVD